MDEDYVEIQDIADQVQQPAPTEAPAQQDLYQAWARERAARGEDPNDLAAFNRHLEAIGASPGGTAPSPLPAGVPESHRPLYEEWAAARRARGEDPADIAAFARHVEAIGAPPIRATGTAGGAQSAGFLTTLPGAIVKPDDPWVQAFFREHGRYPTEVDVADRNWSLRFARQVGRPPSREEWVAHFFLSRGLPLPGDAIGRPDPYWDFARRNPRLYGAGERIPLTPDIPEKAPGWDLYGRYLKQDELKELMSEYQIVPLRALIETISGVRKMRRQQQQQQQQQSQTRATTGTTTGKPNKGFTDPGLGGDDDGLAKKIAQLEAKVLDKGISKSQLELLKSALQSDERYRQVLEDYLSGKVVRLGAYGADRPIPLAGLEARAAGYPLGWNPKDKRWHVFTPEGKDLGVLPPEPEAVGAMRWALQGHLPPEMIEDLLNQLFRGRPINREALARVIQEMKVAAAPRRQGQETPPSGGGASPVGGGPELFADLPG